jgi:hypothetical protein
MMRRVQHLRKPGCSLNPGSVFIPAVASLSQMRRSLQTGQDKTLVAPTSRTSEPDQGSLAAVFERADELPLRCIFAPQMQFGLGFAFTRRVRALARTPSISSL